MLNLSKRSFRYDTSIIQRGLAEAKAIIELSGNDNFVGVLICSPIEVDVRRQMWTTRRTRSFVWTRVPFATFIPEPLPPEIQHKFQFCCEFDWASVGSESEWDHANFPEHEREKKTRKNEEKRKMKEEIIVHTNPDYPRVDAFESVARLILKCQPFLILCVWVGRRSLCRYYFWLIPKSMLLEWLSFD